MNRKGQFSIIAAMLVAGVLIATVVTTYSIIRNSLIQDQPQLLSAVDETDLALKGVLGYTVGYYASVLRVTGDSVYAKTLATNYLKSGLENVAALHPDWAMSLSLLQSNVRAYWYTNTSYSTGDLAVGYDLVGLGIRGVEYVTACKLQANVENATTSSQIRLTITKDEGEPLINLGKQNFRFYIYSYSNSTWVFANPSNIQATYTNGTYVIDTPSGVDAKFCVVEVTDSRGMIVTASSCSCYRCTFSWNSTLYSQLANATVAVELLQNGTIRWLGQSLMAQAPPIPPVPVRSIRVNETINNVNQEVAFQVEDWESEYRVPLGLTSNNSLFGRNNMIVFLINNNANHSVSKVTIWWNGSDTATQTPYSIYNSATSPFRDSSPGRLSNGILNITISGRPIFTVNSVLAGSNVNGTASFLRTNGMNTTNGAWESYPILNGIVRDIVHQEGEWSNGISNCPDVYSQIIVTLPANVTYYTYKVRLMFMNTLRNRNVTDLCPMLLTATTSSAVSALTENGTDASGYPIVTVSSQTSIFYNSSSDLPFTAHHWSQFNNSANSGTGIIFTNDTNKQLYYFDTIAKNVTGALRITPTARRIELLPVTMNPVNFTYALDVDWQGAIATFKAGMTPVYKENAANGTGLWILAEYPPSVEVKSEE